MAVPDYQSLMLPTLRVAAEGETSVPVTAEIIADRLGLSEADREEVLPSGRQKLLHNRIHWAKTYMEKAGLLERPRRGIFVASNAGHALLARNPERIGLQLLNDYPAFREFYQRYAKRNNEGGADTPELPVTAATESTPEDQIDTAYSILKQALKADLLQRILDQSPGFFEQLIVNLLVAMGYGGTHADAARQLGRSGDGGVDGVIDEDRLGLDRIYVQAKRFTEGTIGRPVVQGFVGSLVGVRASKGVFVTTSSFSRQATDYAAGLPQRVILIDGDRLTELMIEHGVGVRLAHEIRIMRPDEDFFVEA